jgi:hypothetical protein
VLNGRKRSTKIDLVSGSSKEHPVLCNVQNGPGSYPDSNLIERWEYFTGSKTAEVYVWYSHPRTCGE